MAITQDVKGSLMQVPMLDLKAQFASIKDEVMQAVNEVCESQFMCLGPAVAKFEKNIAQYCQSKHAIGVSSGSDALILSLMALGVEPDDEVITTPFTFFATAGAISRVGAKPVFVDIDADDFNIDPAGIEAKITDKTKAVMPVHMFGQVAQMKPIIEIAKKHGLAVIEDAAQSIGATQNGTHCGNFGDMGCFSFYPAKNLGGFGDGGLITTNDDKLAERVRLLRTHGENPRYFYKMIGGNFRMDAIQGAVLDVKLKYLDEWNEKRRQYAAIYDRIFANSSITPPKIDKNNVYNGYQYTIAVPKRDQLQKFLTERRISSAIYYPHPLHLQDCFESLGHKQGDFPVAEKLCEKVLSLPVYPELTTEQIEYAAQSVIEFYK